jgi:hypothetical protein
MPDADPRAYAHEQPKDSIRIGCADDRLVVGANPPNPAIIDKAKWEAALRSPTVRALVEERILIAVESGGKVQVENRNASPFEIRLLSADNKAA